jgi:hypothetical protein
MSIGGIPGVRSPLYTHVFTNYDALQLSQRVASTKGSINDR